MSSRHLDFCDLHIFRIGHFSTLSFVTFVCRFHLGALIICMVLTSACCASPRRWNPIDWSGGSILSRSPPFSFSSSLRVQIGSIQSQVSFLPCRPRSSCLPSLCLFSFWSLFFSCLFWAPFFYRHPCPSFWAYSFWVWAFSIGRAKHVWLILVWGLSVYFLFMSTLFSVGGAFTRTLLVLTVPIFSAFYSRSIHLPHLLPTKEFPPLLDSPVIYTPSKIFFPPFFSHLHGRWPFASVFSPIYSWWLPLPPFAFCTRRHLLYCM